MTKRDYYEVLNLSPSCTQQDVRQSYRKLALKWHPDKCLNTPAANSRFNEIQEAYSILSNTRKKQIYDTYGHQGINIDQENDDLSTRKRGFFFEKGFHGTEKCAFDVLKDILQENDDNTLFKNFDDFGITESLKSTMKTFLEDNVFCQENENSTNFFETYIPTFVNPDFFDTPTLFQTSTESDDNSSTEFFSSLFTNNGEQTYSRTSRTVFKDGKANTTTKETFQQAGNNIKENNTFFENIPFRHYDDNSDFHDPFYAAFAKDSSIFVIEEVENPLFDILNDMKSFATCCSPRMEESSKINMASKKISKDKDMSNIRLTNKKPSKKNKA